MTNETPGRLSRTQTYESAAGLRAIADNMISLAPTLEKAAADRIIRQAEEYRVLADEREYGTVQSVAAE